MDGVPRVPQQWRPGSEEEAVTVPLRFGVLGPVRAWRGEEALSTGSPQQRALLAALLLREGRTATAGELIDALWGEEPPSQALAAVRTYASRLRKVLDAGVMVSESGGYAIRGLPEGALDLAVAQDLATEAEKARNAGDLCHARDVLGRALALWDGEVLAGVPGPYAEAQRVRLEEWRLQLLESRLDMDLEQGCHAEAISELTALTAAHPLRERLRELLMLALYRSGRQAEALAVYADTRRLLADELGVDPRPGLSELQQRILRADPGLAEPSAPRAEPPVAPVRPAQLPATVPDFTGRTAFVSELGAVLASAEGRVMAVSALAGIGGVGKTTLAVHVAHQARTAFPDGQLYVDLQGTGARAAEPETVLGSFLRALGTADSAIPDSLEERAALYRSVLDGRRVLVLLDNARDAAQIRPLLPGTAGCAALITSRVRMVDLAGAHLVDLDVMSPDEALSLFTKIVGEERVGAERDEWPPSERHAAMSRLLDFYLATAAGGYVLERPGDRLVDHLATPEYPGLSFADRHRAQDWLYAEAVSLLACVRQCAGTDLLRRAVDVLWAAVDLAESGTNSKAYEQVASALREAAREAGDRRAEARALITLAYAHSVTGRFDLADEEASRARELTAGSHDPLASCWSSNILGVIALYQSRHDDGEAHLARAIEGFRSCDDRPGEASALCNLSRIHLATGRTESAVALARQGTQMYDAMGHALKGANGRYALGLALTQHGTLPEAAARLQEALTVFRDSRQRLWEGMSLFRLAEVDLAARRPAQAASNAETALTVLRGIGGEWRRANVLVVLGHALNGIGQVGRSQVCWRDALEVFEALGAPEADTVRSLLKPLAVA